MNRLTKKDKDHIGGYAPNGTYDIDWKSKAFEKLGQLGDIEEECNIDIIKSVELCKKVNAQKKVYTKESWGIYELTFFDDLDVELFNHRLYKNSRGVYVDLDINVYGKYWALTKEELENEKTNNNI